MKMNKQTNTSNLNEFVAKQTHLNNNLAELFIKELFCEIENEMITNSSIKIEGLGFFRIIRSGENKRVLYLGATSPIQEEIDLSEPTIIQNSDDNLLVDNLESIKLEGDILLEQTANELFEALDAVPQNSNNHTKEKKVSQDYTYIANRKMNLIKTCIITLTLLLLASIIYIIVSGASAKPDENDLRESGFKEIENTDTLAFNKIIVPQVDVSYQYIARIYYGDEIYWPYIFIANKDASSKNFVIRGGTTIRIPRISVDLAGLNDGTVQAFAKSLATDIIYVEKNNQ